MSTHSTSNKGFTLIELALVLAILSILSVLAIRKTREGTGDMRWRKSGRTVDELAEAIVGDPFTRDGMVRDGERNAVGTSFLSDVGRLPRARPNPEADPGDEEAAYTLTLAELFIRPGDILPFGHHPATTNLFAAGVDRELADAEVLVPCGWRGPYLRMTSGDRDVYLSDGWHQPFTARRGEFVSAASGECEARILPEDFGRWRDSSGTVFVADGVMSNGFAIAFVRHLGDNRREEITPERTAEVLASPDAYLYRDYCIDLRSNTCQRLTVNIDYRGGATNAPSRYGARLYGPKDGAIGAWEAAADSTGISAQVAFDESAEIPIGRKILRAWVKVGDKTVKSAPRSLILPKSGCEVQITVY
ncbi:MAG: prepilin-type N-terminal cleavage/methylation domain-containing protein [Kiritimatiellae bacterium]|nr:prepilin-type N-terminal cleavage/methylation domain-containing protein [Kiritimatiellia bacterium]